MRKGVAIGLVGLLLAGAGVGYWAGRDTTRPAAGRIPGSAARWAGQSFWNTRPAWKGQSHPVRTPFHFYDPLKGPPPRETPRQRAVDRDRLNRAGFFKPFQPDLTGPPLASSYKILAAQANRGNVQAANILFKSLIYCKINAVNAKGAFSGSRGLERELAHMRATREDMYGMPTDHPHAAARRLREVSRYCAGETHPRQGPVRFTKTITHWGRIALWSLNPNTIYNVYNWDLAAMLKQAVAMGGVKLYREINRRAAWAGNAQAWLRESHEVSWYQPRTIEHPIHRFADLYTAYLLTRSPYLARVIWRYSQSKFTNEQIREGEQLARRNYKRIQARKGQ